MFQRIAGRTTPPALSDATRHLCVGAYLDDNFRLRCLRDVYQQNRRVVAPSHGFDLAVVLDHCLRARNLAMWRDLSIVVTLAGTAYLDWRAAVAIVAALIGLRMTRSARALAKDRFGRLWTGVPSGSSGGAARRKAIALGWVTAWVVCAIASVQIVLPAIDPHAHGGTTPIGGRTTALIPVLVFALPVIFALVRQRRIENFGPAGKPPPHRSTDRMEQINRQQRGNTVVYSEFEPFIGSGDIMSTWSFAQRLVRKKPPDTFGLSFEPTEGEREFADPPFTAGQLVDHLRDCLGRLVSDERAEQRIPDMTVRDRIFLSGRELGEHTTETSSERMAEIIRNPTMPARHYLACQVIAWGGEVVTTVHIHVALQGRSLYLEMTSTFLAPCVERYRIVDMEGGTGVVAWMRAAYIGLIEGPGTILRAPGRLIQAVLGMLGTSGRTAWRKPSRRRYDRGALVSVREIGTRDKLRNFTQRQDIVKFRKLIERRVIAHVLDFLEEKEVDTTEYRAHAASVLNVGVGHFGHGDMTFQDSVTGQQMVGADQRQTEPQS